MSRSAWRRLQGFFWDHSLALRRPARRWKRALSLLAYRWRSWRGDREPPRVVTDVAAGRPAPGGPDPGAEAIPHPAIRLQLPAGEGRERAERFLARQTETSAAIDAAGASFWLPFDGALDALPPTLLESLLLAAAAEDLELCAGGWTAPARGRFGPSGELAASLGTLLRLPRAGASPQVLGRTVGHVTGRGGEAESLDFEPLVRSGPHLLRPDLGSGRVVGHRVRPVDVALAALPAVPGPRTALFLLPFLAVGGAEHLLFDLLAGLAGYRLLVVTLEPHLAHLGQTVDACRELTPQVYTLGDWLPREAHAGALRHLLRRYAVEALVCWNGSVDFYDLATALRHDFPRLRILNQLYNHRGGWIERYGPALAAAVDVHLAVNARIAAALGERGVAAERVAVVHHGVRVPPEIEPAERARRRRAARERLGLPREAVVAGTFVRLHPQKRPLDVLRLARRTAHLPLHYLLAGGGPAAAEVDRELARRPLTNLTRLPMQDDVEPLYDAADLCLSTSSYEGLPVFLLDGLARGLPCVATAVGEIPELLADGGGVLVERPGDLDALAAGLESLLDGERRAAEGRRGRATVAARFGLEAYRARYERLIFPPEGESDG